jgi:hypothetical protein
MAVRRAGIPSWEEIATLSTTTQSNPKVTIVAMAWLAQHLDGGRFI